VKTLFTLKNYPLRYENMLSAESAERVFAEGGGDLFPRLNSFGNYFVKLTFAEWIDRYRIVIMGRELNA
jgi:hypothetical protein